MTEECGLCGKKFKNARGVAIHKGNTHNKRKTVATVESSSIERTPAIVKYEVDAGLETTEELLAMAEKADNMEDARVWRNRALLEIRGVRLKMGDARRV